MTCTYCYSLSAVQAWLYVTRSVKSKLVLNINMVKVVVVHNVIASVVSF